MSVNWNGLLPAITTPFNTDLTIDHGFLREHARWLVDNGAVGIVPCGSLGEGATMSREEKLAVIKTCVDAVGNRASIIPGIASLSTADAVQFARSAAEAGCHGLMVLPPYVYTSDWREMKAHIAAVVSATNRPCMLYNNPIAYRTDFLAEHVAELASEFPNLAAVKESSADVRRVTAIRALVGDRVKLLVGVDDVVVEGVGAGARGWVAGLVNALPAESVALFNFALNGDAERAATLYRWFLPLLRMDTVPKFVQLIKLVQASVGKGNERVRPPRLAMDGEERSTALAIIKQALANRPRLD